METGTGLGYDERLRNVHVRIQLLSEIIQSALAQAVAALAERNAEQAAQVLAQCGELHGWRQEIELQCYGLIGAGQTPVHSLRVVVSALSIGQELARIGDHCRAIARLAMRLAGGSPPLNAPGIQRMAQVTTAMLELALQAYRMGNVPDTLEVCRLEDQLNGLYQETHQMLLADMARDPKKIGAATNLLQVARELERVGDRAVRIAGQVVFAVTGQLPDPAV